MLRKPKDNSLTSRTVSQSYVKRASSVNDEQLKSYLDSSLVALHQAVDQWRYRNGSKEDVDLCLDAIIAMWNVLDSRSE